MNYAGKASPSWCVYYKEQTNKQKTKPMSKRMTDWDTYYEGNKNG